MDPIEIPRPTIEVDGRGLLRPLIKQLNRIGANPSVTIIEIDYIDEFPSSCEVILPEVKFSPRQAIQHMMNIRKIVKRKIQMRSEPLRTVTYKFAEPYSSLEYYQYTFTNCMSLIKDISIICYLYHLLKTSEYFAVTAIQDLYFMMRDKYHIQDDCMKHTDPNAITMFSITSCFPSISFQWFGCQPEEDKVLNSSHFTLTTFPGLKPLHWHPMIASIIPRLENSKFVPIALLTAINVKTNQIVKDLYGPNYTDCSLNVIYQRILQLNSSGVFPVSLKLKLCKMWGIVYKDRESEYKYADYFTTYRSVAMNIISELKSQDPDLQTILSKIKLEI